MGGNNGNASEKLKRKTKNNLSWLDDPRCQTVLKATSTIAFEFNVKTKKQRLSPFIGKYLAGNYDGRMLSDVMLEDGIIYPDDLKASLQFKEFVIGGQSGELNLRLLTPTGQYRWFRLLLTSCFEIEDGNFIGLLTDIDAETRQRELLRYRAEYDPVSGIFNKTTFFETTAYMLRSSPGQDHFLIRFDVDRFKIINELYSVSEGDRILCYIGQCLQKLARPGDTYARMGDDIFCMCVNRSKEDTLILVKDLEKLVNEYPMAFQFVLSVGILHITDYDGQPVNILCDRAAMAQRTVKGNYVKRYAFYEKSMSDALNREHYITGCMCHALETGQFQIHLQPKFDIRTARIIGAEALARWYHPADGIIPPGNFIPLFERNGFILQLDEYIWELTFKTMRSWLDRGFRPIPVSINVSRIHLHDPGFCNKLKRLSEKYQVPPHLIELEITESAYTECPGVLYDIMDKLQELDFVFSMDDFGSGYSSLNILKDIPVNIIKIDLNFLQDARRGEAIGRGILKGTIQLLHNIGLPIIAEGVETQEQVDFLLNAGCTLAQGFYYAKPMDVPSFEKLLCESNDTQTM